MGMPAPEPVTTIEALLALPEDGLRHELLDGEHVVTPAPALRHQRAAAAFFEALREAVPPDDRFEVLFSPADIRLGPRTLVQPDIFVIEHPPGTRVRDWAEAPVPRLVVEILSPTTAARDRGKKRQLYLEAGVEEYWIVDLDAELVERWRSEDARPEIVHGELAWSLSTGISGTIPLRVLFKQVNS